MSEIDWVPSLVVLAVGELAGIVLVLLQISSRPQDAARAADLEDLRRQKERLLRALRDLEDISRGDVAAERADLELRTAVVMQKLAEAEPVDHKASRKARKAGKVALGKAAPAKASASEAAKDEPTGGLSPEIKGLLKGAAVVAFIALSFFILTRSTSERGEGQGMTGGQPGMTSTGSADPGVAPDLRPQDSARLQAARSGVAAAPESVDAQIELGFSLIEAEGWTEAFAVSEVILDRSPENPDGLVILGVVRLKMGQADSAADLFARALIADPEHLAALSYAGLVAIQEGDRDAARAAWTRARALADGPDATTLDELLAMLQTDGPIPGLEAERPNPELAPPPSPAGRAIAGTVRLAAGASAPAGGVLFIIAHPEGVDRGPPVASRRLLGGSLPATFTIGPGDVMMGGPFPGKVTLSARLDADGNAGTRGDDDLVGSAGVVQAGAEGVEIVLAPR
jgi:tetratricopeptide (TPR) repeat protein